MSAPLDFKTAARHSLPGNGQDREAVISLLQDAIDTDNIPLLHKIMSTGLDLNDHNQAGLCPLTRALQAGNLRAASLLLQNGADPQIRAYTALMENDDPAPLDFLLEQQPPTLSTQKDMFVECLRLKSEPAITRLKDRGLLEALTDDIPYLRQQAIPVRSQSIKDFAFSLLSDIQQNQQKQTQQQQALAKEQRTAKLLARSAAQSPVRLRHKKRTP
ncbi:MAG: hypothetical protein ACQEQL_05345 [Pseudomonadota bacterium]